MTRLLSIACLALTLSLNRGGTVAHAQQYYLGEVRLVGFSECPFGWVAADGRLLDTRNDSALFALFGTTFGGDDKAGTFALPNLSSKTPAPSLTWCVARVGFRAQQK